MAITVIKGPAKSGKTSLAHTMRNTAISRGRGCLLLDEDTQGDPAILVEKLIRGEKLPVDVAGYQKAVVENGVAVLKSGLDAVPWKKDPLVLVIGDHGRELLNKIEERCPGFKDRFGPATGVETTIEEV